MSDERCEPWADAMGVSVPMTALLLKQSDVMRIVRALNGATPDPEEHLEWMQLARDIVAKCGNDPALCAAEDVAPKSVGELLNALNNPCGSTTSECPCNFCRGFADGRAVERDERRGEP